MKQSTRGGIVGRRTRSIVVAATCAVMALGLVATQAARARMATPPGVSAAVRTPGFPAMAATGFGSVWVGAHRGDRVYRIDPSTNHVIRSVGLPDPVSGTLTVGSGSVWATTFGDAPYVYRIDPRT